VDSANTSKTEDRINRAFEPGRTMPGDVAARTQRPGAIAASGLRRTVTQHPTNALTRIIMCRAMRTTRQDRLASGALGAA
jgi:hypothetical protein